jgi:SAM-dependent methyltransferase
MPGFYALIARYYDAENVDKTEDVPFYLQLAEETGGPILDIGCGTGREMFPLAAAGYTVHGIDYEAAMLERAEVRRDELHMGDKLVFHHADVLKIDLKQKFPLVIVPFNGLMHFHEQETQLELLKRLRAWTADDGLLAIDLPNAGDVFGTQDTDSLVLDRTFLEPETGHLVMQQSLSTLDRTLQRLHVSWIYDEITADGTVKRTLAPLVLHYYFYNELKLLLERAGFEVDAVYGDMDYGPFEDGCERMVVLARPNTD